MTTRTKSRRKPKKRDRRTWKFFHVWLYHYRDGVPVSPEYMLYNARSEDDLKASILEYYGDPNPKFSRAE